MNFSRFDQLKGKEEVEMQTEETLQDKSEPVEMIEVKTEVEEFFNEEIQDDSFEKEIPFVCVGILGNEAIKSDLEDNMEMPSTSKGVMAQHGDEMVARSKLNDENDSTNVKLMATPRKMINNENFFKCDSCEYSTYHKGHLNKHIRRHTDKKHRVEMVARSKLNAENDSTNVKLMATPRKMLNDEKFFKCDFCEYSTYHKGHLNTHIRRHTGEKPYTCSLCDYRCVNSTSLKRHLRRHAGVKPFKCKICDYSCLQEVHLVRHKRTHTGEKPYSCNYCKLKFTQMHHLTVHIRTHTGEKPFQCPHCHYEASLKHHIDSHIKSKHKTLLPENGT